MSHDDVVGCYASFTAAGEGQKPFNVLPNRYHASVTSFAVSHKYIIFAISVVSERLPDEEYAAMVDAIKQIQ
jgi:hypothetical protein